MEGELNNPGVDAAVKRIASRIGRPVGCPCCGGTDWQPSRDLVRISGFAEGMNDDDQISQAEGELEPELVNFRAVMLFCTNCWFTRWHAME